MPTDNPQTQPRQQAAAASARINERVEQGAQRVEQEVQSAADAAIQQVRDVRERAESGLEEQRALVSGRVRRFGEALRSSSDHLTREDELAQNLLDGVSERVQRVADYIDHARPEDVVYDLQSFARRQPAVFFGGAFLVGLAIGRFAKSSTHGGEPELTLTRRAPVRRESVQRAPGYDQRARAPAAQEQNLGVQPSMPQVASRPVTGASVASQPVVSVEGSAFGVPSSAPVEPPKPQPASASVQPHVGEPGKGTKS